MKKDASIKLLKGICDKKHVFFTDRGNSSILLALKLAKSLGRKKAYIQDQGGWITYGQFLRKLKFEIFPLETDYGIIKLNSMQEIDEKSLLLVNSMPGYHAVQEDMEDINKLCKKKDCFLINDVSGSIGTSAATYGDIILGSFGEWKPVEVKYGGFIAFDEPSFQQFFEENFKKDVKNFYSVLEQRLKELPQRLKKIEESSHRIKKQLNDFELIHGGANGLVVIARFRNDEEKMRLIDFCKLYGHDYTVCPRYIRVLENAISIEIKRVTT